MNWAAIVLVGGFGLMWLGVVLYAADASTPWMRFAQAAFGLLLAGWSVQKATVMIRA
ncbi:hypothetical protein ACIBHY_22605 [Nonomuraea sp. NPDC050547]|uniref:hypothetical protein n=1 Tax=unclassified Nonomuraea TaxID=2593643 RepID=UPI0037BCD45B